MRSFPFSYKAITVCLVAAVAVGWVVFGNSPAEPKDPALTQATSTPTEFVMEVHDTIKENFWKDLSDQQLAGIFSRGLNQIGNSSGTIVSNRAALREQAADTFAAMSEKKRKRAPAQLADKVLKSLPPTGRSRLYTKKKELKLKNRVQNVNPDRNLYDILGISKKADEERIKEVAKKRKQELNEKIQEAKSTTTKKQAEEEKQETEYAEAVLTDDEDRRQYDKTKAEPTVFSKRLSPDVVHLGIYRYNQDTLKEFSRAVKSVDMSPQPSSLILDLRSNLGGAVGTLPYLLGPFIGPNRKAYRFFQQGKKEWHSTKTGWLEALVPYKKVVILVNEKTQSTGELMASVLKKYNVGTLVGTKTRGWGTIERVFEIDNQYRADREYSLFLVHQLTLRSDGQPIQDRGVVPDVNIKKADWKRKLRNYIPHPPLIEATQQVWNAPPPGTEV